MKIDWWTLALQAINFIVLVWLLWRFLYLPVKQVIAKRKALAEQAFADAAKQKDEADAARQRFEDDRAGLAKERQDLLKKVHHELDAERDKMLEQAKQEADELLEEARKSIAEERRAALSEIRGQAAGLAAELASSLLQQAGQDLSGGIFLERLEKQFAGLPQEEQARLQNDLAADGARLQVVTAAPLSAEEQRQWSDRLGAVLGRQDRTDFATDPDILGGAELRFPHAVLKFTWADQLAKAKEVLQRDDPSA